MAPLAPRLLPETLIFLTCCLPAVYYYTQISSPDVQAQLLRAAAFSALAFASTLWLIPIISSFLWRRGLKGRDMGRRGTPQEAVEMCAEPHPSFAPCLRRLTRPPPTLHALHHFFSLPAAPPRWA